MAIEQLIYDSHATETTVTFCMMVNSDEYAKYKQDASSVAIAEVMNSFEIFKFDHGRSGPMSTPSTRELKDVFGGTTNDMAIAEFMLKNGSLHSTTTSGNKKKATSEEPSTDPRGHMM
jgi:ribosome maturation protein Sdo1